MGSGSDFTFPGTPSLDGPAPHGYRVTRRSRVLGHGQRRYAEAADALLRWGVHAGSGFRAIDVPVRVRVGETSVWEIPFGPLHPRVNCRVFEVVSGAERTGFGHGALTGHPQSGWESYVVSLAGDGAVRLDIRVVWRPAAWWMRAAGPFGRVALHLILRRNLRALDRPVPAPCGSPDHRLRTYSPGTPDEFDRNG